MRKLTLLSGALLVLAFALAGGFSMPRAAWAICYCQTNDDYRTSTWWGMGSDCTAAQNNLITNVNGEARAACGATQTCLGSLVNTTACWFDGYRFQVSGYRYYSCKVCEPIQN